MCSCVGNKGKDGEWKEKLPWWLVSGEALLSLLLFKDIFVFCFLLTFTALHSRHFKQQPVYLFSVDMGFPWNANGVRGVGSPNTDSWAGLIAINRQVGVTTNVVKMSPQKMSLPKKRA